MTSPAQNNLATLTLQLIGISFRDEGRGRLRINISFFYWTACYGSENLRRNESDNMPYYSNVIQYQGHTDQKLVLDLTQPEDYLRSLIENFVRCGYGVQLQRGTYWLSFTDKDNAVQWIDPRLPIGEAFVHARRTLDGRAVVTLKVVQLFFKLEKSEFYCSDLK